MSIIELSKMQITELKQAYLAQLAENGEFSEVTGFDYDYPSYDDLNNVDDIISDELILNHYYGVDFSEDDF